MNTHGGRREGAGRPSKTITGPRDFSEHVLAVVQQADADIERAQKSVRMLRALAIAVANDPAGRTPSWDDLKRAA